MEKLDEQALRAASDEELLLTAVIGGDHELLFLDAYLSETLRSSQCIAE